MFSSENGLAVRGNPLDCHEIATVRSRLAMTDGACVSRKDGADELRRRRACGKNKNLLGERTNE